MTPRERMDGVRPEISVVVCTYNRSTLLGDALDSVLEQDTAGVPWELVVVDNNSSDDTRSVIEARAGRGVRYLFEPRQGLCHARNAGIAAARAPLIAFTDDDVRVEPGWVAQIHESFRAMPEVDYVGGRVGPRWPRNPPSWLTREQWAPLALLDFGDEPMETSATNPVCLVGANLAFRARVFARVGAFAPAFQHPAGSNCCTDDHEMQLRVWRSGGRGMYLPTLRVTAEVQENRLDKAYHRRWHHGHGGMCARMGLAEITAADGSVGEPVQGATLCGAPAHLYRALLAEGARWAGSTLRGEEPLAFMHENQARYFAAYIRARYAEHRASRVRSLPAELLSFAATMLRTKLGASSTSALAAVPWIDLA